MTAETKSKWESIIDQEVYIYGAAKTARELYDFIIQQGHDTVKGFLVTEAAGNPEQLFGLPVVEIYAFEDKKANILVPHLGIYKEEISNLLKSLNFENVYLTGQLMIRTMLEERRSIEQFEKVDETDNDEDESLKETKLRVRKQVLDILQENSPDFGGVMPYQSLDMIGLEGIRPTTYRIQQYELKKILKTEDDVLDIGCNSGFLDMQIAPLVHSLTGIEYDKSLVKVADFVKEQLHITNCRFVCGDFNDWYKETDRVFDVIFSFAIHHWLGIGAQEYVAMLDKLLTNRGGYICFESHLYKDDVKFDECYKEFKRLGYLTVCDKKIDDSGMNAREYILLQKAGD